MSDNNLDKPFRTFSEQLDLLNSRMDTDNETIYYLMRNNYYSVVNFYKGPFLDDRRKETYREGTHFNDLKSLFEFDRKLRILFFYSLTQLERTTKTLIAYHFSEFYGKDVKETYLDMNNYHLNDKTRTSVIGLILRLNDINNNDRYTIISHYQNKNNFPFWVTIHFLSFGEMSILFSLLKNDVKNLVIDEYKTLYFQEYNTDLIIDHKFLRTFLKSCTEFRNAAGHNERFFNYNVRGALNITNTEGISSNKSKLFSIYEGLKFFLSKSEYSQLTKDLKNLISELEKDLKTDWSLSSENKSLNKIGINDILKEMDFPENWHK